MYYFSIASECGNLFTSCQKAKRTLFYKGSFECKQAAKSMWTLNSTMSQPRDSTAYVRVCNPITRKRSLHISMLNHMKGDSITSPDAEELYSNNVPVREVKPLKVAKPVGITIIVRKQLETREVKIPNQKYYKIINLIATDNLEFQGASISKIKFNPNRVVNHCKNSTRDTPRLIKAPLSDILITLKKVGIVSQNKQQLFIPRGLYHMQNFSNYEIIRFYNSELDKILNFFRFASNRHSLSYVIRLLKISMGLTLARKMKLRGNIKTSLKLAGLAFGNLRDVPKNSFNKRFYSTAPRLNNNLVGRRPHKMRVFLEILSIHAAINRGPSETVKNYFPDLKAAILPPYSLNVLPEELSL